MAILNEILLEINIKAINHMDCPGSPCQLFRPSPAVLSVSQPTSEPISILTYKPQVRTQVGRQVLSVHPTVSLSRNLLKLS